MTTNNICTEDDYNRLPETERAELIEGQFYDLAAPSRIHQEILMELSAVIRNYIKSKKGLCKVCPAPFAVKLFADRTTIVEPDISVICKPDKLTEKGCSGAPDWIIEIVSPRNPGHDYVKKRNLYMDAGVREYWIVDPLEKTVLVYHLFESRFIVRTYTFHDKIKAEIFDDLWIDFKEFEL